MLRILDKILEQVRQLSPDERRQLRERLDQEAQNTSLPPSRNGQAERETFIKSLRGKYASVQTSSEAFNRRKQEEIELEDRRR